MITICNSITGSDQYLCYDNSWSWKEDITGYLYGGTGPLSIEPLLKIHGINLEPLIPEKYITMSGQLGLKNPYYPGLIGSKFKGLLSSNVEKISSYIKEIQDHRYTKFYYDTNKWLWSLSPAPVDVIRYNSIKAMGQNPGYRPQNGFIPEVRYDRSRIKTGRLSVISGPQVMTMKAEWRNMAKGCRQIDFSSMEPMFLLNLLGKKVEGDLYDWVAKTAGLKGDRTYTKIAIISSMYGSKKIPEVEKLFGLDEWCKQIEADVNDGIVENYYGRPIKCEGVTGRHLLSLWLQSSAADAAIKGFSEFFQNNLQYNPHWIIHDACVFSGEGTLPGEIIIDGMKFPVKTGDL